LKISRFKRIQITQCFLLEVTLAGLFFCPMGGIKKVCLPNMEGNHIMKVKSLIRGFFDAVFSYRKAEGNGCIMELP